MNLHSDTFQVLLDEIMIRVNRIQARGEIRLTEMDIAERIGISVYEWRKVKHLDESVNFLAIVKCAIFAEYQWW
jgi:hypothetical protein